MTEPKLEPFEDLNPGSQEPVLEPMPETPSFGTPANISQEELRGLTPTPKTEEAAPEPERPRKAFRDMQDRIKTLFAQKKDAEAELSAERGRVVELERRLADLEQRQTPAYMPPGQLPTPKENYTNPFEPQDPTPQQPISGLDLRTITDVVTKAVKAETQPLTQRLQQQERINALVAAQSRSWEQAAVDFPEIAMGDSEVRRAAEEILRHDGTLRFSPDGPRYAVLMARGLLADEERVIGQREQAKQVASTVASASGVEVGSRVRAIQKEIQRLQQSGGLNGPGINEFVRISALQRELARLKGQGQ